MTQMEYRYLGDSSIKTSVLSLGCRGFGRKAVTADGARLAVRKALELGINFFDTADVYGDGQSEAFLASALERVPRDSYILATKGGTERLAPGMERQNGDPGYIRTALEGSLRRLKTDYIDLYQLHNPDPAVPFSLTAEALVRFREEGKIRAIGVSNMEPRELDEWVALIPDTASIQLSYSMLDRAKVSAVFNSRGTSGRTLSLIPWGPLFAGLIVDPPSTDREKRTGLGAMFSDGFVSAVLSVSAVIREMAADHWTKPAAIALAFVLARPEVATVPVGATLPVHIVENLRALSLSLKPAELDRLNEVARGVPEPEILMTYDVADTLDGGTIAVLPFGLKVRVPGGVKRGDRIRINLWDGRLREGGDED